jgi:hypothetical protein
VEQPLWSASHISTHNALTISQRPDRSLLLSLYEQSKQVLQVRVGIFGPLPDPQPAVVPRSDETLQKALAFLRPLAERYSKGEVDTDALIAIRDDELSKLGLKKTSSAKAPRKRPASTMAGTLEVETKPLVVPLKVEKKPAASAAKIKTEKPAPSPSPPLVPLVVAPSASTTAPAETVPVKKFKSIIPQMPYSMDEQIAMIPSMFQETPTSQPRASVPSHAHRCASPLHCGHTP